MKLKNPEILHADSKHAREQIDYLNGLEAEGNLTKAQAKRLKVVRRAIKLRDMQRRAALGQ